MCTCSLITLKDVAIGYKNNVILDSIQLSIRSGQFWGILGPNGGGKTTFVKTVLGLIPKLAGNVSFPKKVVFGYVPQLGDFDSLFPISTLEVVSMGRYSRVAAGKRLKPRDLQVVEDIMEKLSISDLADRPFRSLSAGERQRALIARAMVGEPDVLVLDEPTSSMDAKGKWKIMELMERLLDGPGLTVLMVSHELHAVTEFADHLMLIDKDRNIFHSGTLDEILNSEDLNRVLGINIKFEGTDDRQVISGIVKSD